MGRVLLCLNEKQAETPYYARSAGIRIYNLEELSFFLQEYLYMTEQSFFNDDLIRFLSAMDRLDIARHVEANRKRKSAVFLARDVVNSIGGLHQTERDALEKKVQNFDKKSPSGRQKLTADAYFARGIYEKACSIYESLLGGKGGMTLSDFDAADIYLKFSRVYLKDFRWQEAADALVKAYELTGQEVILRQLYEAYRMAPVRVVDPAIFDQVNPTVLAKWQFAWEQKEKEVARQLDYEFDENRILSADESGVSGAEKALTDWIVDFRKINKTGCQDKVF